jgi:hypothetical protein
MSEPFLGKMHFTRMDQGTDEDFQVLKRAHEQTLRELPDRLLGLGPNARDRFKGNPAYERTVEFCAKYDEVSFDPRYPNEPQSTFEPMVRRRLAPPTSQAP